MNLCCFLFLINLVTQTPKKREQKKLTEFYDKGGPQNKQDNYEVKSWIFLPQDRNAYTEVDTDSLETIWCQWRHWRESMEITIESFADLDESVSLYC